VRERLLALLALASSSGLAVAAVPSAHADRPFPARLPALPLVAARGPVCPIPMQYREAFVAAARTTSLPLPLLVAVAEVESRFRADAVSAAGARGLLQVMPTTAAAVDLDADIPAANVLAGARYFRMLLDRFRSTDLALAAYNAGPAAVERAGGAPGAETLTYVANVTARWRRLRRCR
jgi:soluble lytic murein transglycosylase-like protein